MAKYKWVEYKASNIKGFNGKKIMVEEGFVPKLDTVNALAVKHKLIVWVTDSDRKAGEKVKGAIVTPAKMGNHFVGHAIDCNLQCTETKEWFNSKKMGDNVGKDLPFLLEVDLDSKLRWGGKFTNKDEVHIDDALNIVNPELYKAIYKDLQE